MIISAYIMPLRLPKPGLRNIDGHLLYLEHAGPHMATLQIVNNVLSSEMTSAGQLVETVDLELFGKSLFIEHIIMITLYDEYIYHETLVHPTLLSLENPEKVLIIGGGDGGALREVLKHPVGEVTLVELDKSVIETVKKHIPEVPGGSFEDPRLKLIIGDGRKYVESCEEKYDAVILDLTDPYGQAVRLYTKEFYSMVRKLIRDGGLMVTHSEGIHVNRVTFQRIYRAIRETFKRHAVAKAYVPSFNDEWSFSFGSDYLVPPELDREKLERRFNERLKGKTRFYLPEIHYALFSLPAYLKAALEEEVPPSTDDNPAEIYEES
ncbi:polyamine aminopropyltransferase [Candidatus Korarchaeum cryptofilum]|jgi:spermidine synthase|uniref:Polyamine aminopropyltransferase n=2 Tax=Candidatus Korarchaeum cryptofilum TaxID=498846 RepID=A0A429GA62_9CREN|nr:polyamine aminopropyltransferase [Candidatus Korarchaeum cryptofilum]